MAENRIFERIGTDKAFNLTEAAGFHLVFTLFIQGCAAIHILFIVLFASQDIMPMVVINILSSALYISMYLLSSRKVYSLISFIIYCEILLHAIAAIIFTDWEAGFGLYLVSLVPIAYFCPFKYRITSHICAGISCFSFFTMWAMTRIFDFSYSVSMTFAHSMYILNGIVCFGILFVYTILFTTSLHMIQKKLNERNIVLRELACIDPLTGLMNRRVMYDFINEIKTAGKCSSYSIAIADIDDFKIINDTYGHDGGDYVLKTLSSALSSYSCDELRISRWGGEEFLFLFTGNSAEIADCIMERILIEISEINFVYNDENIAVTLTAGISSSDKCSDIDSTIIKADNNLYYGKTHGKDCVVSGDKIISSKITPVPLHKI